MTKQIKLSALVVALLASTAVMAHEGETHGYTHSAPHADALHNDGNHANELYTGPGEHIVRNNYGECWQNTFLDKAANGLVECGDKEPVVEPKEEWVTTEDVKRLKAGFLFGFDKDALRPEARDTLDQLAVELSAENVQGIQVIGNTDFMGSEAYNQKLSERRATAVTNYLVNRGVPAGKIQASGAGERNQVMQAQCEAEVASIKNKAKRRTALIACIEPDRNVEIRSQKLVRVQEKRIIQ